VASHLETESEAGIIHTEKRERERERERSTKKVRRKVKETQSERGTVVERGRWL